MLHYVYSHVCQRGWGWEYRLCGAFCRLRNHPSLGGIWGRGLENFGKPSSRLVLGSGPCGSLRKQEQFGNPQGP